MFEGEFQILFRSVSFAAVMVVNNLTVAVVACDALNEREPS